MSPFAVFAASFATVFVAELVGDKTLYTLGSLATRYRTTALAAGASVAFMSKMAVAVALGGFVRRLPPWSLGVLGAATFFSVALVLWRKKARAAPDEPERLEPRDQRVARPAAIAFAAVFFSEWGDPGQIAAATFAARYGTTVLVWAAASLAMFAKGLLGLLLGIGLRRWVPRPALRYVSVGLCVVMGVASLFMVD